MYASGVGKLFLRVSIILIKIKNNDIKVSFFFFDFNETKERGNEESNNILPLLYTTQ